MLIKLINFSDGLDLSSLPQTQTNGAIQIGFNIVVGTAATIAVLIIVLAGFKYITSSGDPQAIAGAKRAIVYSLVGLAVCFAAWSIVTLVVRTA